MQQRQNPTPPGPQGPPPGQGPPARPPNAENLHALQKAIDTMEEKGKMKIVFNRWPNLVSSDDFLNFKNSHI